MAILFLRLGRCFALRRNVAYPALHLRLVVILLMVLLLKLGIRCVRRAVSGAGLTDFGKAACASLLLVLSCALSPAFAQAPDVVCPVGSQAMTGSGTESTPYQVTNICQLQGINSRPAAYYVLMDNIDASTTKDWNGGKGFEPIASAATGGFSGSFVNSDDFEISSLTISRSTETYVGLFSRLAKNGKIEGIMLAGSRTTGRDSVGSLVGSSDGVIEDCTATGSVSGLDGIGGLVGQSFGDINNSYATGQVSGQQTNVGGLVGLQRQNSSINNSYATGSVSGQDNVGGLVGAQDTDSNINNSYATGLVSGAGASIGGLVGQSKGNINNSYATGSVFGKSAVGGLAGLVFRNINNSYATGSVFGQVNVGGLVGLQWDVTSISNSSATGSVSGRGDNVGGLVGRGNGIIDNSYATGRVSGGGNVGGLMGLHGFGSRISDSYATGSVFGAEDVGGIAGQSEGDINNSYAMGSVFGQNNIGGLVGLQFGNSSIKDSYATGPVSGTGDNIGGYVGYQQGDSSISGSYATGSVSGVGDNIGGLMGRSQGNINNSYATGSVFGAENVGGIAGRSQGNINNSYATGSVSGTGESIGGFVGYQVSSSIVNSYYPARGRNNSLGIERTFAQLRCPTMPGDTCPLGSQESTYEGWDTRVWDFGSAADLPQLSSNRNSELNRKPYINGSTDLVVGTGFTGVTQLFLEADYPGTPRGSVTPTWSLLFDEPPALSDLVYFNLENGTTSTEANGSVSTLTVVVSDDTAAKSFYIVLKNDISANDDRIRVLIVGESPLVDGGREQIGKIWEGSTRTTLKFSATDQGRFGSGGAGLSWRFFSTDRIAEGSTVRFSSTQRGGEVEVEVVRPSLNFYDVGSFVLEIESPAGAKTMFTVTIEMVCSTKPGADLMAGQTGTGRPVDPYRVERLCQLQDVSSSPTARYELVANIDASRTEDWNGGAGFGSIANFSGSFVSTNNYVISSLTISRSDTENVGLFSRLAKGATIRGVILVGSRMTGLMNVGSLVGSNAGVIVDCSARGSVVSGGDLVGGLVGRNEEGASISRSYAAGSSGSIIGVGGLVGGNEGNISNSYATGSVFGQSAVGGLVGSQQQNSSIRDSYATAFVSGQTFGGLVGFSVRVASIVSSYYTGQENGLGERRTLVQLRCPTAPDAMCPLPTDPVTYAGWDSKVWNFGGIGDLPQLRSATGASLALRVRVYLGGSVR